MFTPKEKKVTGDSRPTTSSPTQSESTRAKESRFVQLEQATKNLLRSSIRKKDHTISNAIASIQFNSIRVFVPQDYQEGATPVSVDSRVKDLPLMHKAEPQHPIASSTTEANSKDLAHSALVTLQPASTLTIAESKAGVFAISAAASGDKPSIFSQNVTAPSLQVPLPAPGARLETTMQLAYCNQLLHAHLSPSSAVASITVSQDLSQQASVEALLQNIEEQQKIRELAIRVVEEFVTDGLKNSEEIAEVVLLGPLLDQEYYRKLLNCFIGEFEAAKLLDIDLLQGLVQLVQCAGPDYLQPDDLVRMLVVLRARLQDTHQQTTKHPYYLTLALSRLLDVMVGGKVQDLSRVVDHEPLSALLGQLMESSNPYLKHQAAYALQGLLHVPNDETRRQFVLRHAGNVAMALLGVASVCNLDLNGVLDGAGNLRDATVSALEIGTKAVGGVQSLYESGQGIGASIKGGIFSGGRLLWYAALREAQEHVQNGRLLDFNRLVCEAPCRRDVEFQWGVCQLLGEIAVNQQWEVSTRQHAADFLAELYRNNTICNSNKELDSWIFQIIHQVVASPDTATSSHAQLLLKGLDEKGDFNNQMTLYHDVMDVPIGPYPLRAHSSGPSSSPLLARVQGLPDVEYDLHRLRMQRLKEGENALYVPPQAKPSLQSSDDTLFPLMEKMLEFLTGSGQVFLLLGESGGGKSTFNLQLERTLWKDYMRGGAIPLHINLPAIDDPLQDMITKQLQRLHLFSEAQIQELRQSRQFIVICDGYDESQLKKNIYVSNLLNQPGQWRAKMVISCRSQYLGSDYRSRFQPAGDRYQQPTADLFQEGVVASFSRSQIEQYVEQFVQMSSHAVDTIQPSWKVADYMDKLNKIPKLIELVANPFLLTMALRALPKIARFEQDLSTIRLTRVGLYDNFIEEWLDTNKLRLESSTLSTEALDTFEALLDEGFVQQGITFQKDLAAAIFQHQDGAPVVSYSHIRESRTWKAYFFGPDAQGTLLRESSPLTRSGNQYRFLHRSILEYLYSRVMSDPIEPFQVSAHIGPGSSTSESVESFVAHPLNQRSIVSEPSILLFLAERMELEPSFKSRLLNMIEDSKTDAGVSQAAANAISILVRAGVPFHGADLRGIKIPGADIRGGQFDSTDMQGADLSNVDLAKTWLRQANLSEAKMTGVHFGELPYLEIGEGVTKCVFSPDGALLVLSTENLKIIVYETATWTKIVSYAGGYAAAISPTTRELAKAQVKDIELGDILTGDIRLVLSGHGARVSQISYSHDGEVIATGSYDYTIRMWTTSLGDTLHVLRGHTDWVYDVAFSPGGLHLVSCSKDKTIRTWDTQTGESLFILEGNDGPIRSVAYSPDGRQIASVDELTGPVLWDAHSGIFIRALVGHLSAIYGVAYSPDGHQLASCGRSVDVRLWDTLNGELFGTLSGHNNSVFNVSYSPSGKHITSGSADGTVRLWDVGRALPREEPDHSRKEWTCVDISPDGAWTATGNRDGVMQLWGTRTGKSGVLLIGHKGAINKVVFSPCGELVVSAGLDATVRLWCAHTGMSVNVLQGHTRSVYSVVFSPSGHQLASCGLDKTVRLWDSKTGEPGLILEGHTGNVNDVAFSPSGHRIASCSKDETVRLWCSLTGEQLVVLYYEEELNRVMFSPDGPEVVSISWAHNGFCCWDTQSGEKIEQPTMEKYSFLCILYAPCGKLMATGGRDGMLRLWDRNLGVDTWSEVYRSFIRPSNHLKWRQGLDGMYMASLDQERVIVWEMIEKGGSYTLHLLWSLGRNELSLADADLSGAVGLNSVDIKLVEQRGAITESTSHSE